MSFTNKKPMVYAANVAPLTDRELFAEGYDSVSTLRREKVDRCRFDKDKRLSLGCAMLLDFALSSNGIPLCDADIKIGEQGKPYFDYPSVHFSLSHSEDFVVCALSEEEIGTDVEKVKPIDLDIAKRFFSKDEYMHIMSFDNENDRTNEFFRIWTVKESFVKAIGLGLKMPFDSFSIDLSAKAITHSFDEKEYTFEEFNLLDGYKWAISSAGRAQGSQVCIIDIAKTRY